MSDSLANVGTPGFATAFQQVKTAKQQEVAVLKIQNDNLKQEGEAAMKLLASANVAGPVKVDVKV